MSSEDSNCARCQGRWRGWGAGAAQREGDPRQLTPKAGLGRVPSAADDANAFGILGS